MLFFIQNWDLDGLSVYGIRPEHRKSFDAGFSDIHTPLGVTTALFLRDPVIE